MHLGEYPLTENDLKTLAGIKKVLSENTFDLIMITGDLIWGKENEAPRDSLKELYDLLNTFDVPVAITYGNHDTEGMYNRKYLRDFESHLKHLAVRDNRYIVNDRENYTLNIFDEETDKLVNVLYVWDSGDYFKDPKVSQYAAIGRHQIDWYIETSKKYSNRTFDVGFMHIPLPEYKEVDKEQVSGSYDEKVCSADINSGLFYEIVNFGKIKALFAGHDHDNNFSGTWNNVSLNYGNVTGYNTYGHLERGVLQIDLYNDKIERKIINF
ncbi:metallophosphoesterase [Companilactobacillus halodurans]|uniref:metallophosphoesterase n=1 Tax=Companilactobacillus halodurans TaxID=2584183 RepID=UPI00307CD769